MAVQSASSVATVVDWGWEECHETDELDRSRLEATVLGI